MDNLHTHNYHKTYLNVFNCKNSSKSFTFLLLTSLECHIFILVDVLIIFCVFVTTKYAITVIINILNSFFFFYVSGFNLILVEVLVALLCFVTTKYIILVFINI